MKELLENFSETYIENYRKCQELDQSLMEEMSFPKWKDALIGRSEYMRSAFRQNELFLGALAVKLRAPMTEERADLIFQILWNWYYGEYDDLYLMDTLAEPILAYYEQQKNYERCTFLYTMLGYENIVFCGALTNSENNDAAQYYYEKGISMREHYREIRDPGIRACIFSCYSNLVSVEPQTSIEFKKKAIRYYYEAMSLWESPMVQRMDRDNQVIKERIEMICEDVLTAESFVQDPGIPEEFRQGFIELVGELEKRARENGTYKENVFFGPKIKCRLLQGEDPDILIGELIAFIQGLAVPDYEGGDEEEALQAFTDYHNAGRDILDIFTYSDIPKERQDEYLKQFADRVTDAHTHVPLAFCTSQIDGMIVEWFECIAPFIRDANEKRELLMKLVISRQPMTYIHSLMVSEIASRIGISVLKREPDYFVGILGCTSASEVKLRQDELFEYFKECAMLHDCGKTQIVEIVNRQNRHLYDPEFEMIRSHPQKGIDLLKHDPAFEPYFDVILGHHKSYDGKRGYPEDFNNTASPVKAVIDLITIADGVDAATDILGRNYTAGKDFARVFGELQEGAGTRYSPEIVELIARDKSLFADLTYLTGEGRHEIYYRAYREIIFR